MVSGPPYVLHSGTVTVKPVAIGAGVNFDEAAQRLETKFDGEHGPGWVKRAFARSDAGKHQSQFIRSERIAGAAYVLRTSK
jgi:hypothetical protein